MVTHRFAPLAENIDNSVEITRLFRDSGPDTTILLIANARYKIENSIQFIFDDQHLITEGEGREGMAVIETVGNEATAINMLNRSNCSLKFVHIAGGRGWGRSAPSDEEREGRLGWIEGGGALVLCGGPESRKSIVSNCRLEDPRGWTALHVVDWAHDTIIRDNIVGPCGQEAPAGPWADGLSIAGVNSIVEGNTIIDATDGQIVVFCAPGSQIRHNTIISKTRGALGGINLVDSFPFDCDYRGTVVHDNIIRTEDSGYINLAIGIGPTCWSPWVESHGKNYGGRVENNTLGPGKIGYGIGISGAKDWTVHGNRIEFGTNFTGSTATPGFNSSPPTAFLVDDRFTENCSYQNEFVHGDASWLIGIRAGKGNERFYRNHQLLLRGDGSSSCGSNGIKLEGVKVDLVDGALQFREKEHGKKVGKCLWSSGVGKGTNDKETFLEFTQNELTIKSKGQTLWNPTSYLKSHFDTLEGAVLFSNDRPFVTVASPNGDVIFATHYEFKRGFELKGGNFISIAPKDVRGVEGGGNEGRTPRGPPIPPRPHHLTSLLKKKIEQITNSMQETSLRTESTTKPTFLFLNSLTAQLILHSSPSPTHPEVDSIHWTSSPGLICESSWLVFQPGDGNLVLYYAQGANVGVSWTSGTTETDRLVLRGLDEGGPSLSIVTKNGEVKFCSR